MKLRWIAVAAVCLAMSPYAMSDHTLTAHDGDGCETFLPFKWIELAPGEKWEGPAELVQCQTDDFGHFLYYGYLATPNNSEPIRKKDGIVLTAYNEDTGEVFTFQGKNNDQVLILAEAYGPCMFRLSAENTTRKPVQIRLTWTEIGP